MKILDTTIRDGSYAVDFKFTCANVSNIVERLTKLGDGIEFIEVGHGMGLNASSAEHGYSLYSDTEYLDAARKVSKDAQIGMFCIPGIARIEDLHVAKEHGLTFVRVGVPADQTQDAIKYVAEAKKIGLTVMVNFMKTYALFPEYVAEMAGIAINSGADYIYIVDSAGCMLPEQLSEYYEAIKGRDDNIKIGFHGHNNLGMAVANSLLCVEKGFDLIDCSFQGLGRSLGNTSTEMFVMALKKRYGSKYFDMDIPRLLEYGYVSLKEISGSIHIQTPLDLVCGYAGFHSGFIKDIFKCCCEYEVDPLRLIIAYSEYSKTVLDYGKLCEIAKGLPKDDNIDSHPYSFRQYFSSVYSL